MRTRSWESISPPEVSNHFSSLIRAPTTEVSSFEWASYRARSWTNFVVICDSMAAFAATMSARRFSWALWAASLVICVSWASF